MTLVAIVLTLLGVLGGVGWFLIWQKLDTAEGDREIAAAAAAELSRTVDDLAATMLAANGHLGTISAEIKSFKEQSKALKDAFDGPPSLRRPPASPRQPSPEQNP